MIDVHFRTTPNGYKVKRWYEAIEARPAVRRGLAVMKEEVDKARGAAPDKKSCDILFGKQQFERR